MKKATLRQSIIHCLALLLLGACSAAYGQVKLTSGEWPPYLSQSMPDGGLLTLAVTNAFHAVDIHPEYGFFPWARSLLYARRGEGSRQDWHGSLAWVKTDERLRHFWYSDPVFTEQVVLFYHRNKPVDLNQASADNPIIIGGTAHTYYPQLEEAQKQGKVIIQRAGNYDVLLKRLINHRVDAIPISTGVGKYYIETSLTPEQQALLAHSEDALQEKTYHVIFSKAHPHSRYYLQQLNKGLALTQPPLSQHVPSKRGR